MSECPVCKKASLRSRVQVLDEFTEEKPLTRINEDDGYHFHDNSVSVTTYQCTNGHEWIESTKQGCRYCETLAITNIVVVVEDRQ